jgi:hypothetical protein
VGPTPQRRSLRHVAYFAESHLMAAGEAGDQSESDDDSDNDSDGDNDGDGDEADTNFEGVVVHHLSTPASTYGFPGPEPRSKTTYRVRMNMPSAVRKPPNPDCLAQHLPKSTLPPLQRTGPLNLNADGTDISYRKSHAGPNAHHWIQADAEEMERLFTSGTIRPLHFPDIPEDMVVTYVNPVCSEKLNDDAETLKLRTRVTIGGDRIDYPNDKSAVTANMEALKLLINAMISENANWSTIDISDFYLGTPLPHPEHIRIQRALISPHVILFYDLERFMHRGALYCSVHKTH